MPGESVSMASATSSATEQTTVTQRCPRGCASTIATTAAIAPHAREGARRKLSKAKVTMPSSDPSKSKR